MEIPKRPTFPGECSRAGPAQFVEPRSDDTGGRSEDVLRRNEGLKASVFALPSGIRCHGWGLRGRIARFPELRVEFPQGCAATPSGNILEQNLQVLVQALDIRCIAESRTASGHELRRMENELHMSCAFSLRRARHS